MTYEDEIMEPRKKINKLNVEILNAIKLRLEAAGEIAAAKKRHGKPVVDKQREEAVLQQVRGLASERGIDPYGAERVFREIISLTVEAEERSP